jgi:hypothetical protein
VGAFSENSLFEQGAFNDSFYSTGSNPGIGENPGTFTSALRDKTQFRMSFPVKNKVKMLPNSSSIYYFNVGQSQWNIPFGSIPELNGFGNHVSLDTRSDLQLVSSPYTRISFGSSGSIFVEDEKLFDTHGNCLGSGSLNIFRISSFGEERRQKINEECFSSFNIVNQNSTATNLLLDMPKSIQRNSSYDISNEEFFTLPIEEPFLIEKVVFEVPFCFGNGWFKDKTSLSLMTSSAGNFTYGGDFYPFKDLVADDYQATLGETYLQFVDVAKSGSVSTYNYGGPGIVLSLMSQKNYGTGSIRDLICRGFVTHADDTDRDMLYVPIVDGSVAFHDFSNMWYQLTPLGVDTSITNVDGLVSASYEGSNKFFTGSVVVKSNVEISNGIRVIHTRNLIGSPGVKDVSTYNYPSFEACMQFISRSLDSAFIPLNETVLSGSSETILTGIDPFGRGMTGFSPSGGSIFGSEYVTANKDVITKNGRIRNTSYFSGSKRNTILSTVSSSITFFNSSGYYRGGSYLSHNIKIPTYYFIGSKKESPYLIYPGEKITLSVTKNRPTFLNFTANIPNLSALEQGKAQILSSSFLMNLGDPNGHDVQLNTGSINITFYGSYVRQGNKYIP